MSSQIYLPPWRAFSSSGQLGAPYGPTSAAAYAKQVETYQDWSFKAQKRRVDDAELICAYMCSRPEGVPESETDAFTDVFEKGMSVRGAAEDRGISRSSVRCYLGRLRTRAKAWEKEQG